MKNRIIPRFKKHKENNPRDASGWATIKASNHLSIYVMHDIDMGYRFYLINHTIDDDSKTKKNKAR